MNTFIKTLGLVAALALVAPSVMADDCKFSAGSCNTIDNSSVDNSVNNTATATGSVRDSGNSSVRNANEQEQKQQQQQQQGQGQKQTAIAGQGQAQSNNSSGNEVTFTQNYEAADAKYAPDAYAPSTAPCTVGVGGSFGNGIFAGSLSTGYTDETCRDLEVIRVGIQNGDSEMKDAAKKLYRHVLQERLNRYEDNAKPETTVSNAVDR